MSSSLANSFVMGVREREREGEREQLDQLRAFDQLKWFNQVL